MILFGIVCVVGPTFLDYKLYVRVLKWSCLSLFAYVAALATVKVPWGEALKGLLVPTVTWNADYFTTLVAIAGTTISPYLFFWQAAQEAEDVRINRSAKRCFAEDGKRAPRSQESALILRSGWASPI